MRLFFLVKTGFYEVFSPFIIYNYLFQKKLQVRLYLSGKFAETNVYYRYEKKNFTANGVCGCFVHRSGTMSGNLLQ